MVTYEPTTALLVVDLQNDFADPSGSLYVKGGEEVVPFANAEIERARAAGASVLFTQDWHPQTTPHFQKDGGIWPVHCVQDTWGADFHADLVADGPAVRKGVDGRDGYSGFSVRHPETGHVAPTRLESLLRIRAVEHVVICGLATDYCVVETALDAKRLGFQVLVPREGTRAVDLHSGDGDRAFERMRRAGVEVV
jgi:nicotinamidase/pyrazinamidase